MVSTIRRFFPFAGGLLALPFLPVAELLGLGPLTFFIFGLASVWFISAIASSLIEYFRRSRRRALLFLVAAALFGLLIYPTVRLSNFVRMWAFSRLADRSKALVFAIEDYHRRHARPPESLASLVPELLPRIPSTGMLMYPTYEYSTVSPLTPTRLHWYDLGSRHGKPFQGLWKYPDGLEGHTVLVLSVSRDGTVVDAAVDRAASDVHAVAFDEATWKRDPNQRAGMVAEMRRLVLSSGVNFRNVAARLGPADGDRTLVEGPWELRVPCSRGALNWDVFFYWPGHKYPVKAYGGSIQRIGDWAYVHE